MSGDNLEISEDEQNADRSGEKKKRSPLSYIIEGAMYVCLILLCVFWVPEHVIQRTVVNGSSMQDTLHTGESLLVEKVSYHFSDPARYDIIVFYPYGRDAAKGEEDEEEEYYVKRIYGLPGEMIQIKGNQIYVNDEVIDDEYAKNGVMDDAGIASDPIVLGEDEYFVLGDNRQVSKDSREPEVGPVKRENIAGHVILRIWPLNTFGIP